MLVKYGRVNFWAWILGGIVMSAAIFYVSLDVVYANKVWPGVWLGEINLGGQPIARLPEVVDPILKTGSQRNIGFRLGEWEKSYSLKTLGINFSTAETVEVISKFGRGSNAISNLGQRLYAIIIKAHLPAIYQDQLGKLDKSILEIEQLVNQAGVDGEVIIDKQKAIIKPAVTGLVLNKNQFEQIIRDRLSKLNFNIIELPAQKTLPEFTTEMAQAIADQINQSLNLSYILKTRTAEIELSSQQLWAWVQITQQSDSFRVKLKEEDLRQYLQNLKNQIDQSAINAILVIKNERAIEFVPDQVGVILDIEQSIELIQRKLLTEHRQIDLPAQYIEPKTTLDETNNLGIKELVAKGESNFSGSPKNRRHNIKVGANKFDKVIIRPNEKFSFNKLLGIVDSSTGYLPELVIKGDETTPEFGGGLCQVSTTTFRAALDGGYPIIARQNHSYRVSYYEPAGTDATVYQPYPDFQFLNDTPHHLLIHTYIEGDNLHFDFYGTATGQKVELEGPIIYDITDPPEPIYIETSTLPEGEQKKIDTAHKGADTILYRHIFDELGREIRKDTFKSHYIAWPEKYLVGVSEAPKVETNLGNIPPETTNQESTNIPINNN